MHHCDICKKDSLDLSNHIRHVKIHLDIKQFECTSCGRTFIQSGNCKSHIRKGGCGGKKGDMFANPITKKQSRKLRNVLNRQGIIQSRGPYTLLKENEMRVKKSNPLTSETHIIVLDLPPPLTKEDLYTFYMPHTFTPIEELMLSDLNILM